MVILASQAFLKIFENVVARAKMDGSYDHGIAVIKGCLEEHERKHFAFPNGDKVEYLKMKASNGLSWEESLLRMDSLKTAFEEHEKGRQPLFPSSSSSAANAIFGYYCTRKHGREYVVLLAEKIPIIDVSRPPPPLPPFHDSPSLTCRRECPRRT